MWLNHQRFIIMFLPGSNILANTKVFYEYSSLLLAADKENTSSLEIGLQSM